MCSIFGSFSYSQMLKLAELNASRGGTSHSITVLDMEQNILFQQKQEGPFIAKEIGDHLHDLRLMQRRHTYYLAHIQTPTTVGKDVNWIHPCELYGLQLWHNGILRQSFLKKLHPYLHHHTPNYGWDTEALLQIIASSDERMPKLSDVEGSFACVLHDPGIVNKKYQFLRNKLYIFRNQVAPMWHNNHMTISSVQFHHSRPLPADKFFAMVLQTRSFIEQGTFTTKDNPYKIPAHATA